MEKSEISIVSRHMATAPVDVQAILSDLGIRYQEIWMDDGASGSITRDGNSFTVAVNALESDSRQRFTAAHELAHFLLHRDLMHANGGKMNRHTDRLYGPADENPTSPFTRQHEVQANRLAAQILMPAALVRTRFAEYKDPAQLAIAFGVSKAAMEIRLRTLQLMS